MYIYNLQQRCGEIQRHCASINMKSFRMHSTKRTYKNHMEIRLNVTQKGKEHSQIMVKVFEEKELLLRQEGV